MQSHLLVWTVRWRIRPHLDLELLTTLPRRVGRRPGRFERTERVFLEYPRRGTHTIALLEAFFSEMPRSSSTNVPGYATPRCSSRVWIP